ncbi:MAG: hypothetical protein JO277_08915 [Candidatus Eremiobacteraeota bacterium]|nr:hypothetical protein [Candidatus Eremiobacteraeota bacterium]
MITSQAPLGGPLGFSVTSPFRAVGRGVAKGAKATGRVTKKYGKYAVEATNPELAVMAVAGKKLASWALTPVRHRVQRLKDRRAVKLAWDRRKSKTPTDAEKKEARDWTKHYLNRHPPHGPALALLAGPSFFGPSAESILLGEVVTAATVSASVPVLIALMNHLLGKAHASGEAPANPGEAPLPAASSSAGGDGTVDTGPAQDAGTAAEADANADASAGGGKGGKGGGAVVKLPGVGAVPRKYLVIGGVVVGAVVLVALLKR